MPAGERGLRPELNNSPHQRRAPGRSFLTGRRALCAGLALLALLLAGLFVWRQPLRAWLVNLSGEKDLLPQLKALGDVSAGLLRPAVQTADLTPVQFAGVNPFGVNVFLEQEVEPEKRELAVKLAADAGFHWLRQEFPWEDIEISGKGDFWDHKFDHSAWDKYDHIVTLAEKYHLELIVRLSNPPAWTRRGGNATGTYAPPDNFADYGDFVAAVVSRYQGRVRFYQLWNEPNIYPEWGERPVNPEEYAELLKVGATRARTADPNVVIILGALASTIELTPTPPYGLNDLVYLQRLYDAGAAPYFDILAMQGYGLWSGPTDRRMHPRVINFSRPRFVRDLMVRNGDAAKPIWISEMNWNAVPDDIPDKRFGQVSEGEQAQNIVLAYQRLQAEWPWLGVANVWYLKRATDQWEQERKPEAYFRLLTPDFRPLPAYDALATYTARPPQLGRGFHQEDHWALTYEGNWQTISDKLAVLGQYRRSIEADASLRFTVDGRRVTLVMPPGGTAHPQASVDGRPIALQPDRADPARLSFRVPTGTHQVLLVGAFAVDGLIIE
ncbi:cellulase family glycosylhydrolase [Candidatus Amarolinea dominans]|uniref:cellulase family glycosylhydrolase n=1 Tax=Candidatus Amarolinea dominans TaxID=3140696 RepID=UPI003136C3F0|nr:cellulase family glycosylhydrolase [Anaerolineae bacterium]